MMYLYASIRLWHPGNLDGHRLAVCRTPCPPFSPVCWRCTTVRSSCCLLPWTSARG